jgi:hypothetical protein
VELPSSWNGLNPNIEVPVSLSHDENWDRSTIWHSVLFMDVKFYFVDNKFSC